MSTDNRKILAHILANDGATMTVDVDQRADIMHLTEGWMVSRAGLEHTVSIATFCLRDLDEYLIGAAPWLGQDAYVGAWIANGLVYFDVSDQVRDFDTAVHLGYARNQLAIYNNATNSTTLLNR